MNGPRIATRGSALARWQAEHVRERLAAAGTPAGELVLVETTGDLRRDVALGDAGAVGLFTSEVQNALLRGDAECAVHSLKDLPAEQTAGLIRAAVPERAAAADLLLCRPRAFDAGAPELPLAEGAAVGTSAARRAAFLRALRPDARPVLLRGNVPTRVAKLRAGDYDAIVVAAAGVRRLGLELEDFVVHELPLDLWPCAPGQGALAVECRAGDDATRAVLEPLQHEADAMAVSAERSLLQALGGGCGLPLGASVRAGSTGWRLDAALGPTPERPGAPPLVRFGAEGEDLERLVATAVRALRCAGEEVVR